MDQPIVDMDSHHVTIRVLTIADYDILMACWQSSGLHIRPNGRESRESFAKQLTLGVQTPLGAFVNGTLAGAVLATHDGRKGWINRLGIAQAFQRQGVGRQLVQAAEDTLKQQGITVICVLIEHWNTPSLKLFEAEGFKLEAVHYLTKRESPDA